MNNILFICSRNKWRSLTAETIYKNNKNLDAKSAGTDSGARIKVNGKLISWADIIFVMERKPKEKLKQNFPVESEHKRIVVLEIEDNYRFMDEELIEEIKAEIGQFF